MTTIMTAIRIDRADCIQPMTRFPPAWDVTYPKVCTTF
jgi:hypothetical protein